MSHHVFTLQGRDNSPAHEESYGSFEEPVVLHMLHTESDCQQLWLSLGRSRSHSRNRQPSTDLLDQRFETYKAEIWVQVKMEIRSAWVQHTIRSAWTQDTIRFAWQILYGKLEALRHEASTDLSNSIRDHICLELCVCWIVPSYALFNSHSSSCTGLKPRFDPDERAQSSNSKEYCDFARLGELQPIIVSFRKPPFSLSSDSEIDTDKLLLGHVLRCMRRVVPHDHFEITLGAGGGRTRTEDYQGRL